MPRCYVCGNREEFCPCCRREVAAGAEVPDGEPVGVEEHCGPECPGFREMWDLEDAEQVFLMDEVARYTRRRQLLVPAALKLAAEVTGGELPEPTPAHILASVLWAAHVACWHPEQYREALGGDGVPSGSFVCAACEMAVYG